MEHRNPGRTPEGRALFALIVELTHAFYRLRAKGAEYGAVTAWGGSALGILRSLKEQGPKTVPEIARMRPVARQHIQKLANELAADGLVEFIDNPAHKRSRLLRLTRAGEAANARLSSHTMDLIERLAVDMDEGEMRSAAHALEALRGKLEELA